MSTRIPLPGQMIDTLMNGVKTGSNFYTGIMNPILKREQLKQTADLDREHQKQLENHFQLNYGLSKAASGRAAQAAADAHKIASNKLDPTYPAQQFEALKNFYINKGQKDGGQQMPGNEQPGMPAQEMGEGMGVFSPEGMQGAQQQAQATQQSSQQMPGGLNSDDLNLMKQYPPLRGMYKKIYGVDPLAPVPQTPEEKQAGAINQAISIDEAKANRKKVDDIESTARPLLRYAAVLKNMKQIINNKPDLTGNSTALADWLNLTRDPDVARFKSGTQTLQSKMAKDLSGRGGYGVAKLVESAKAGIGKSGEFNKGALDELSNDMKSSFDEMKSEYERLNKKPFPYKYEQYFDDSSSKKRLKFNLVSGRLE